MPTKWVLTDPMTITRDAQILKLKDMELGENKNKHIQVTGHLRFLHIKNLQKNYFLGCISAITREYHNFTLSSIELPLFRVAVFHLLKVCFRTKWSDAIKVVPPDGLRAYIALNSLVVNLVDLWCGKNTTLCRDQSKCSRLLCPQKESPTQRGKNATDSMSSVLLGVLDTNWLLNWPNSFNWG